MDDTRQVDDPCALALLRARSVSSEQTTCTHEMSNNTFVPNLLVYVLTHAFIVALGSGRQPSGTVEY